MTQRQAIQIIEKCKTPAELLGKLPFAKSSYLELAKLVHPDVVPSILRSKAESAFKKLQGFYDELTKPKKALLGGWMVEPLIKGDLADLYWASHEHDGGRIQGTAKIVRSAKDNDLMTMEATALKLIGTAHSHLEHYAPRHLDSFKVSGRMVNVMARAVGYTADHLSNLINATGTMGKLADFRHIVWMGNRLWTALGFFHKFKMIHGAIIPPHLIYDTDNHGLTIVDWCYSHELDKKSYIKAISKEWKHFYPPEVLEISMSIVVVAGLGWGDEGKGTMVDYFTREHKAKWVVRYNGGPQAAHNVVLPDGTGHQFHQFGSGSLAGADTYLSEYMLIHPQSMITEKDKLRHFGVMNWPVIDERCVVVTPYHIIANQVRELLRGDGAHGTCGWGVGEAVSDSIEGFVMLHMMDLKLPVKHITEVLKTIQDRKCKELTDLVGEWPSNGPIRETFSRMYRYNIKALAAMYYEFAKSIRVVDRSWLGKQFQHGSVIFEGAQGLLLDQTHGVSPPHVTWSDCTFKNAFKLLDSNMTKLGDIPVECVGVVRSYLTRHGKGPFPSEVPAKLTDTYLTAPSFIEHNETGMWQGEFRMGYFDSTMLRYSLKILEGVDNIALTHVDRIGPDYRIMAPMLEHVGSNQIERLEEILGTRIGYLSNGPTWPHKLVRLVPAKV